jgi:hypothetical protein
MRSVLGIGCGRGRFLELPLPTACAQRGGPAYSQIGALILMPGNARPSQWDSASDFGPLIQGDGAGRYLHVTGGIARPETNRAVLGRPTNGSLILTHRKYTAQTRPDLGCDAAADFVRALQKNWRGWRFWAVTAGGYLIGGPRGIKPAYVDAGLFYPAGRDDLEQAYLDIEWFSSGDEAVAYVPGLADTGGSDIGGELPEPPETFCEVVTQSYVNQSGNVLTVTVNGGSLPTPYPARVWVFMNGQKLNQGIGQYTLQPDTAPGQSTVTINPLTHFPGSDYQVFLFP